MTTTASPTRIAVLGHTARDVEALSALLASLGHEVSASAELASAAALVREQRPAVAVISSEARSPELGALARRLRDAAEAPLPLVFALPESAWWLRVSPGLELAPLALVRRAGLTAVELATALQRLGVGSAVPPSTSAVAIDAARRRLEGPAGAVRLTPAEGALAALLLASAGQILDLEALCTAVWGVGAYDLARESALRTHVHTLRGKLRQVGAGEALVTEPGRGYRFAMS